MGVDVAEIVGFLLVVTGLAAIVGAAAMVSVALAVLVAGVFLAFAGVVTVFVTYRLSVARASAPTERRVP